MLKDNKEDLFYFLLFFNQMQVVSKATYKSICLKYGV